MNKDPWEQNYFFFKFSWCSADNFQKSDKRGTFKSFTSTLKPSHIEITIIFPVLGLSSNSNK